MKNSRTLSKRVEVMDTLNGNEITVYNSMNEASLSIGCSLTIIRRVLKDIKEKGNFSRLIKQRYKVKPIDTKS